MKFNFPFLLLLLLSGMLMAQPSVELEQYRKKYPQESAVLLKKKQTVDISLAGEGLSIVTEHYEERFLLDNNNSRYAEESVFYSGFYDVTDISAVTMVPGKRKYREVSVRQITEKDELSSGVFHDDVKSKNFIYPALQEGAKTVLYYRQQTKDPHFLKSFYLAELMPVEEQVYEIRCDKGIEMAFSYFNTTAEACNFNRTESNGKVIYSWSSKEMPELELEESAPNHLYYIPHIIPRITSYEAGGKKIPVLTDVADLHAWYHSLIDQVDRSRSDELVAITDSLTKGLETELEKVKAIYDWVQNNIKYIAVEDGLGGFIPRAPTTVCENRYGDCKDMSSIIHQMLDIAGIGSHITWVGTRDIPYSYKEVPTPNVDNHMITTYIRDSTYYFLDATGQYSPIDLPSGFIQGKEVMINRGDDFELFRVPVAPPERSQVSDTVDLQLADGRLSGQGKAVFTGYQKLEMTERVIHVNPDKRIAFFKQYFNKGSNKFLIDQLNINYLNDKYKPLSVSYHFNIEDYVNRHEDEIYLNMHLEKLFQNNLIPKDRKHDIERDYQTRITNVVNLEIPPDFQVDYLPKDSRFEHDKFGYHISYREQGQKLILETRIDISHLVLLPEDFTAWNQMVNQLGQAYSETVLLKQHTDINSP